MSNRATLAVSKHRALTARRGLCRVEVNVSKADAVFIRQVAAALCDPARQAATRMLIRQRVSAPPSVDLKALLASAPLDGIDLTRASDVGRDIDL